jgi:hypothetical protein
MIYLRKAIKSSEEKMLDAGCWMLGMGPPV